MVFQRTRNQPSTLAIAGAPLAGRDSPPERSGLQGAAPARRSAAFASLVLFVLVTASAHAQLIDCVELQQVLDAADTSFSALAGEALETDTEDTVAEKQGLPLQMMAMRYERNVAATLVLASAETCEVISVRMEDDESSVSSASFDCRYPGVYNRN